MLDTKALDTKILERVNFSTETKNASVTVNAGNLASVTVPLPTKKAIGIVGVTVGGTGSANMSIWQTELRSTDTTVSLTNTSGTNRTVTVYVQYIVVDA